MDNILKLMDEYIRHEKIDELERIKEEINRYCGQWSEELSISENCEMNKNITISIIDNYISELKGNE